MIIFEKITLGISLLAIIISIGSIIISIGSIIISNQSNRIERRRDKAALKIGKTALHSYLKNYFIINIQRTKFDASHFEVLQDEMHKLNYINELEVIANRIDDLITEPYYSLLYQEYPLIGSIPIFIRTEVMYINEKSTKNEKYGYDHKVWNQIYEAFKKLNKQLELENNISSKDIEINEYAEKINNYLNNNTP